MLILNVSVYPNGKKYVVEPHFPLHTYEYGCDHV